MFHSWVLVVSRWVRHVSTEPKGNFQTVLLSGRRVLAKFLNCNHLLPSAEGRGRHVCLQWRHWIPGIETTRETRVRAIPGT